MQFQNGLGALVSRDTVWCFHNTIVHDMHDIICVRCAYVLTLTLLKKTCRQWHGCAFQPDELGWLPTPERQRDGETGRRGQGGQPLCL